MASSWTWAARRQALIMGFFMGLIFLIGSIVLTNIFLSDSEDRYRVPLRKSYEEPEVFWSKTFPVSGTLHGAVAHFSNFQGDTRSPKAVYRLTFFNEDGEVISTRKGETFFGPNESFYVFERDLHFEETPEWTTLSWEDIEWEEAEETNEEKGFGVDVYDPELTEMGSTPRLEARVVNTGTLHLPSVEAVALIYDEHENTISASRAILDSIRFNEETELSLSWPDKFNFLDELCSPPLEVEVVLLDSLGEDISSIKNELEEFEESVSQGFLWSFEFFNITNVDLEEITETVKSRSRSIRYKDNPLFVLVLPKDEEIDVSEIKNTLESYDFAEILYVARDDNGRYLPASLSDLHEILDRNCIQNPGKIRVHSRVLR